VDLQPSISSPTDYPSIQPSSSPTEEPTFVQEGEFNQRFQIGNEREFNETEQAWFCEVMEGYTDDFGGGDNEQVNTTCEIISQRLQIIGGSRKLREGELNNNRRILQGFFFNQVEYSMTYRSRVENVTAYLSLFEIYVNGNLDRLTADLQNAGLAVTDSRSAFKNVATEAPTTIPTGPTSAPSLVFTRDPSIPDETAVPTVVPTLDGSPTPLAGDNGGRKTTTVVTVSVIAALSVMLVALCVLYRQHQRNIKEKSQEQAAAAGASKTVATGYASQSEMHVDTGQPYNDTIKIPPLDSKVSNELILSAGTSPLSEGSERGDDKTHNLADEFDQYKDQNLEKMRTGVEDNISGFDGAMSQALTKVLMGDDDTEAIDMNELRWGGSGDSIEIEATALYEVTDWLKRKELATVEERCVLCYYYLLCSRGSFFS
jgi:hypothetical protein